MNIVNTVSFEELETLVAAMTTALRLGTLPLFSISFTLGYLWS